jgi:ABC-type molybdate transport system substrate-binding protein
MIQGRIIASLLMLAVMAGQSNAAEPVLLHAAGSLRFALTEVANAFEKAAGVPRAAAGAPEQGRAFLPS